MIPISRRPPGRCGFGGEGGRTLPWAGSGWLSWAARAAIEAPLREQYARSGRHDDATTLMDRLLDIRNDLGLLSEEYDPTTHAMLIAGADHRC